MQAALRSDGPRWFDGLAALLAADRWRTLSKVGLDRETYTTGHVAGAPSRIISQVEPSAGFETGAAIAIERFEGALPERWSALGLSQPHWRATDLPLRVAAVGSGLDALGLVPGAARVVGALVRCLVPLATEGPDYDVSYSVPDIPFSVFIGIHDSAGPAARLRMAESLLHEAMHLQLTLIEAQVALVAGDDERMLSPWQHTERPVRGILHGLYVFRAIEDFLHAALAQPIEAQGRQYCLGRTAAIRSEIGALDGLAASTDLTFEGRRFAAALLGETL